MQQTLSLQIVRVVDGWDMRMRHKLREQALKELKYGACLVALNGKRTMARIVDGVGGVHDYYADAGVRFDIDGLSHMLTQGMKVRLSGVVKHDRALQLMVA